MDSDDTVYRPTTTQETKSKKCFQIPSRHLDKTRFAIKVIEVLLSSVAFILQEVVEACSSCFPLYFFEFVSCLALLFTILLLVLLSTDLHRTVHITCWPSLDLVYTAAVAFLFLIASITFLADNEGSQLERAAAVFGLLATVAFAVDVAVHIRTKDVPFCKSGEAQNSSQRAASEAEKLNSNGGNEVLQST
ncbi:CKLF-like MARVEL transmembrane domain-containing protein 4 [Megalops cyprinoides]|uniref:CKLF-like MARVEL transmembrane domain-containing protein 4 n=1 Tax=Megalops cyprinoides TaxID=118141 RepID=UPI001864FDC3|nr:CKLF-like MARVEL transmembrane domain-containing protein 4 [Megalops cyprinoides]